MASIKDKRFWDDAWKKLSVFFSPNGNVPSPFGATVVVDEPLTLYVETAGSDAGTGSINQPFRTVQAAFDSLEGKDIASAVTIQIGAGDFSAFLVDLNKLRMRGSSGSLAITGTWSVPTLTTGTVSGSGTASVSDLAGVMTDSGQSWTVNELKGKYLYNNASYSPIVSNTATTITVAAGSLTTGTYSIWDIGTNINNGTVLAVASASGTSICRIGVNGTSSVNSVTEVSFSVLKAEVAGMSANRACVSIRGQPATSWRNCTFSKSTSMNFTLFSTTGGAAALSSCYFFHSDAQGTHVSVNAFAPMTNTNNYLRGGATGFTSIASVGNTFWGTTTFDTMTTGIVVQSSMAQVQIGNGNRFLSCTTGILCGSTSSVVYPQLSCSTTSTTFFSGCTTCLQVIRGRASLGTCSGSGNTNGIVATLGATVQIAAAGALGSSTELSVDGSTATLATMRANSPKVYPLTPNAYGTYIYE